VIGMCFTGAALVGATVFEEGLSFFNNWDVLSMLMNVQGILFNDWDVDDCIKKWILKIVEMCKTKEIGESVDAKKRTNKIVISCVWIWLFMYKEEIAKD
jgi:hypothetical protein